MLGGNQSVNLHAVISTISSMSSTSCHIWKSVTLKPCSLIISWCPASTLWCPTCRAYSGIGRGRWGRACIGSPPSHCSWCCQTSDQWKSANALGDHLVHPDKLLVGDLLDQPAVLHEPGVPGGEVDGGAGMPPHVVRRLTWETT